MRAHVDKRLQIWLRGAGILLLGGLLVFFAGRHPLRLDLSRERSNSLSERTEAVLNGLESPLAITLFFPDREPERSRAAGLLGAFSAGRPSFSWEIVDPGQEPRRALAAGISEPGSVLLVLGDRREHYVAGRNPDGSYRLDEDELTGEILAISRERRVLIRVMQGSGFRPLNDARGFSALKQLLEMESYEVLPWSPLDSPGARVPDGTDLLIIPGPHRRLPDPLLEGLAEYLAADGPLLLLLDPALEMADEAPAAGLDSLLASRNIRVGDGFVVDLGERNINLGKGFELPIIAAYGSHPLCADWLRRGDQVCLPMARSLSYINEGDGEPIPLAFSSPQSFEERGEVKTHVRFDEDVDRRGPLVLALLSDPGNGAGRLLLIGDSDFASNTHIDWESNANFVLDSASWLIRDALRVPPSTVSSRPELLPISRDGRRLYFILTILALPAGLLLLWPVRLMLARRKRGFRAKGDPA